MAQDVTNPIGYYLSVPVIRRDDLGAIRHWVHLKMAIDGQNIWLKGFNATDLNSFEIKMIPGKCIYYEKDTQLYPLNSLLPAGKIPALLWTSIDRGLPVKLPTSMPQISGLIQKLEVKIVPSVSEREASAMIIPLEKLGGFLRTVASIRLKRLKWVIIQPNVAFLMGNPLLSIAAEVYWKRNNSLFPVGYDLERPLLCDTLEGMIDPEHSHWILWNKDSSYVKIEKIQLTGLSLGSYRRTLVDKSGASYG